MNNTHLNLSDSKNEKILGKIRHYPSFNKEWKDSSYSYNKNYLKDSSFKYKLTNNIIKSHFSLNDRKGVARSKRMRGLIRRSSSKRIFISKSEIKQTNDKVIVTVYTFDREKQFIIRNLYFHNRNSYLYNLWLTNSHKKASKNAKTFSKRRYNIVKKAYFPYNNIKFNNESDFLRFRSFNIYKKFLILNKYFTFLYISHVLSIFNIKIFVPFKKDKKLNNQLIKNILKNKPDKLIIIDNKSILLDIIFKDNINIDTLNLYVNASSNSSGMTDLDMDKLNNYLWCYLEKNFINTKILNKKSINFLYTAFRNNHYDKLITKYFKRKSRILHYFIKLELSKLRFNNLFINLKSLISRVYNKTVELNIINLKYIYLNSDIYTQFIENKLKKKANMIRILQKSLNMVKIPHGYFLRNKKNDLNNLDYLNSYKSLYLSNFEYTSIAKNSLSYKDKLDFIIEKLFPNSIVNNDAKNPVFTNNFSENKRLSILNTIKYKWIKGFKLEIAGRLTRRNTAARSVFKFRYKGNLNNKQYYLESNYLYNLSTTMIRNSEKSNTQYTLLNSKKRIGAFGIKSWISSY